jgi:hypothetical protein
MQGRGLLIYIFAMLEAIQRILSKETGAPEAGVGCQLEFL